MIKSFKIKESDSRLISGKNELQVGSEKISKRDSFDYSKVIVKKPWGYERWISDGRPDFKYVLKEIFFRSPFRTSTQVHKFKEETNYILSGKGILFYSEENFDVEKYENNEYSKDDITKFLAELKKQELIQYLLIL